MTKKNEPENQGQRQWTAPAGRSDASRADREHKMSAVILTLAEPLLKKYGTNAKRMDEDLLRPGLGGRDVDIARRRGRFIWTIPARREASRPAFEGGLEDAFGFNDKELTPDQKVIQEAASAI